MPHSHDEKQASHLHGFHETSHSGDNEQQAAQHPPHESLPRALFHQAMRHKKEVVSFWFLFIVSIAFGVAVSYGVLGPMYLTPAFEKTLPAGYGQGIYLSGVVETLDLDSRALGIQWLVYSCEETGPYSGCNALTEATNFFVDGNASPTSSLNPATANTVYKANFTGYITDGLCDDDLTSSCWQKQLQMGVPFEQTLQTNHQFSIRTSAYNWRSNSQAYPFDVYMVYTTLLAIDPSGNGTSRNILGLSLTGTVPNFSVEMQSRPVTNPAYPFEWRMVTISIARAQIVVGYAFLIWFINWLMTGVVLWITVSAVQGRRKIPGDLFAVPITALFALPTVRSAMPGSPAFGCILDYSGIILNLAVLAVCSVSLLLSVIARDGKELYTPEVRILRSLPGDREDDDRAMRLRNIVDRFINLSRRKSTATASTAISGLGLGLSDLPSEQPPPPPSRRQTLRKSTAGSNSSTIKNKGIVLSEPTSGEEEEDWQERQSSPPSRRNTLHRKSIAGTSSRTNSGLSIPGLAFEAPSPTSPRRNTLRKEKSEKSEV